jgi:hypothetical protein
VSGLLALDVAKDHLHETGTARDADIQRKADAASLAVVGYLAEFADPTWTPETLPADVQAAMLIFLTYLEWPGAGELDPSSSDVVERTWKAIEALLMRRRLPSIA